MRQQRVQVGHIIQPRFDRRSFFFQRDGARFQLFWRHPGNDGIRDAILFPVDLGQAAVSASAGGNTLTADLRAATAHFVHVGGDDIRVQQIGLDGGPQAAFSFASADEGCVGAAAGLAMVGTAPVILRHHGVGTAAAAAGHEAGEQAFRPPGLMGLHCAVGIEPAGHLLPDCFIHDAQFGHVMGDHVRRCINAGNPFARGRVFLERLAVVEDAAPVKFVVEDAVAAGPAAGNGIGPPKATPGCRDTFCVQLPGNGQRAGASGIGGEDAPDHFGLFTINFPQALLRFPIITERAHGAIAIG